MFVSHRTFLSTLNTNSLCVKIESNDRKLTLQTLYLIVIILHITSVLSFCPELMYENDGKFHVSAETEVRQ